MDTALTLFGLKKLLAALILPPTGPLLLIATGLLLSVRRRRAGLVIAWSGVALALALTSPLTVNIMLAPLERAPAVSSERAASGQAIVILGGGKRSHAPEYGGETPNRFTLERLRYGAHLARETGLPLLVSGGALYGHTSEAELMRDVLENEFGVTVRWVETQARDTRGNARHTAALLQDTGIRRVLLVTHATHVPRAQAEFEHQGLDVIAAPTGWLGRPDAPQRPLTLLPDATAARAGWFAAHEWLGAVAYRLSRKSTAVDSQGDSP